MKIAFDEHIPIKLANAFKAMAGENEILRVEIVSAKDFSVPNASSDVPWLQKFKKDGGRVVISGDTKMRGKLHEQKALLDAGFIVFFLARKWNQEDAYIKSAMLIKLWPKILDKVKSAKSGQFFELPFSWTSSEFRNVTPPAYLHSLAPNVKKSKNKPAVRSNS